MARAIKVFNGNSDESTMTASSSLHLRTTLIVVIWLLTVFNGPVNAAEFYKYQDHNGTIVFTENLLTVPSEFRDKVEKITLPGGRSKGSGASTLFEDFSDREQLKTLGKKQLRKGKVALRSFLQDQKVLLAGYVITGIILFVFLSRILKALGSHILKKIIFKVVFVTALFCGAYFWYLSYLDKNVLNFDLESKVRKSVPSQLTTPMEMLKKTKALIDQINTRTEKKQEFLDGLE